MKASKLLFCMAMTQTFVLGKNVSVWGIVVLIQSRRDNCFFSRKLGATTPFSSEAANQHSGNNRVVVEAHEDLEEYYWYID